MPQDVTNQVKDKLEQEKRERERHSKTSDWLYIIGAALVSLGLGLDYRGLSPAMIAAGFFCLVFPVSELALAFVRGLKK